MPRSLRQSPSEAESSLRPRRGRRTQTALWEARRQEVERLVRAGQPPTKAAREATGYTANALFARYFPDWWASLFEIDGENRARREAPAKAALVLRQRGEAQWRAAHCGSNARTYAMFTLIGAGWTFGEISGLFGVTRQRVQQIVAQFAKESESPRMRRARPAGRNSSEGRG